MTYWKKNTRLETRVTNDNESVTVAREKHSCCYHIRFTKNAFTLLNVVSGQGYSGEKGPRGFNGDDGEPVCKTF